MLVPMNQLGIKIEKSVHSGWINDADNIIF